MDDPRAEWEAFAPREVAAIRALADYADELFPGHLEWQVSDQLFAFQISAEGRHRRIWVALDQWIVVEVGRRHWEIPYGDEGETEARAVLLSATQR